MLIFKTQKELKAYLINKNSVGFVPTMGALHQGHMALLSISQKENQITGCSIFVNPTQFNSQTDFNKYPVTIEKDLELLLEVRCDFIFLPTVDEMYPEGLNNSTVFNLGYLDKVLEGAHRPGHFNGVCVIVQKLLLTVMPNNLYMGEKDFQQCMVVKRLLEITSLPINLIICPTLRDDDGLAKSSRNMRLSKEARSIAQTIYQCLLFIKTNYLIETFENLQHHCFESLKANGFATEYISLANASNLELLDKFDSEKDMVVLIAAKLDGVRLIDNMRLNIV